MIETSFGPISALQRSGRTPLVLMLHGLQGTKELFSTLSEDALFKNYAFLAPDFPGFGESPCSKIFDYSLQSLSKLMEELVGTREVIVLGHSLGGMIGTLLLKSKLIRICALISLEGNLSLADCGASKKIATLSEAEFIQNYLPELKRELAASSAASAAFRLHCITQANSRALYQASVQIVEACKNLDLMGTLSQASIPRLLLVGEKSSFATREIANGTEVALIPNAGHFLIHDNYSDLVSKIRAFMDKALLSTIS